MLFLNVIVIVFSFVNFCLTEEIIKIKENPLRGALIDYYDRQVMIIKIKSPSDVLKDSISKLERASMHPKDLEEILKVLGNIEYHYQKQFTDILAHHSELIASPYPIKVENGNGQMIDISSFQKRNKRQIWRALFSFLRLVRPATRIAGKITKYGRFLKSIKYAGYAASAAIFSYELADIFGAIPDKKYDELSTQLLIMHENRINDLKIMQNITLLSLNTQQSVKDLSQEVDKAIGNSRDRFEMSILVSQVFASYLQQLTTGILLLMQGKLPSYFVSLETQIQWLETKLPGLLLNEISSITPHLTVTLKGIDSERNQLIILIEVPKVTSSFQILNFVEWEPEVYSNGTCYTSPKKSLFLAYPPSISQETIRNPLLIDPESCLTSGYIMCESDSIINHIPDLSENRLCIKLKKLNRGKRDIDNLFEMANTPTYDITRILENTLEPKRVEEKNLNNFENLKKEIDILIKDAISQKEKTKIALEKASDDDKLIKILFFITIPSVAFILSVLLFMCLRFSKKYINKRKEERKNFIEKINQMRLPRSQDQV